MFRSGHSPPCKTARRGWPSDQKNVAQRPLIAAKRKHAASREAGVVFRRIQKENHPGCVGFGGFAKFLMTQPPLLAVMQGGEYNA